MMAVWKRALGFFTSELWSIDISSLSRLKATLIRWLRLIFIVGRETTQGELNLRATSLVYTTLLSIVPLLAVSFSVLKAFGVHSMAAPMLNRFLAPLGPQGADITARVLGFVDNMKVGVLGSVGLALLFYTVVSVIYKMEGSLNFVWRVDKPRALARRFSDYTSVLLVGPILIFSAIGLTAAFKSNTLVQKLISFGPLGVAFYVVSHLMPFMATCAAFTFTYAFIPNTKVKLRAALVGGLCAGILWEASEWAFASFVASSAQYSAIYSGFAILVLFLIWLYWSWLVFLAGAAVSFYAQHPHLLTLTKGEPSLSGRLKEKTALSIMYLVGYNHYHDKPPWTLDTLAGRLRLPAPAVGEVLGALEKSRLVLRTSDEPAGYAPARDIETITLGEVVDLARSAGEESWVIDKKLQYVPEVEMMAGKIEGAISGALKGGTIKGLVLSIKKDVAA
jgi:membrane protein